MTKKEAADYLGRSTRAVERWAARNRLTVKYRKGATNNIAEFDRREVEALKQELEKEKRKSASKRAKQAAKLTPTYLPELVDAVAVRVADLVRANPKEVAQDGTVFVPIAQKLTLNLAEASALSGLSENYLTKAIRAKKLRASKERGGGGWNIKRADLDEFVEKD